MKWLIILLLLMSCGKKEQTDVVDSYANYIPSDPMSQLDGRPTILVVGDSISLGYTPHLQDSYPSYQVIHNNGNGRSSGYGAFMIERWVTHAPQWEVCLLNHGMWDILINEPLWDTTGQEYYNNLKYEISIMRTRCNKILIPNITRVPVNHTGFDIAKRDSHNTILENLASEEGIPVCDLFSVSETITHLHDRAEYQDDVHFTSEGSRILADELVNCIDSL